ncbi:MAG: GNAT family N-acetyltransferase [Rhizomicrobium sp.]
MNAPRIRDSRLTHDKPAILEFIFALQLYEHVFEANRRADPQMAEEHYAALILHLATYNGKIFIAEDQAAHPIGWAAVHESEGEIFIRAEERRYGFLAELYVVDRARGTGVGRALIMACEDWARDRKLVSLRIGVLARNSDALKVYERAGYAPYALQVRKYL